MWMWNTSWTPQRTLQLKMHVKKLNPNTNNKLFETKRLDKGVMHVLPYAWRLEYQAQHTFMVISDSHQPLCFQGSCMCCMCKCMCYKIAHASFKNPRFSMESTTYSSAADALTRSPHLMPLRHSGRFANPPPHTHTYTHNKHLLQELSFCKWLDAH